MTLKIGIVTPTFNRPEQLRKLHHSIAGSSSKSDWCHYVVDDGSELDYTEVASYCSGVSSRLKMKRIANSGPLVARNHAIDMALQDGATHLCFIDDDDELLPGSLTCLPEKIDEFPDVVWFMFGSKKESNEVTDWPATPVFVSWFDDVVLGRKFGSDNLLLISADLVGNTRFSSWGKNQREWTFMLDLAKKQDQLLVCPEKLRKVRYSPDGLTEQARQKRLSLEQIGNNVHRAYRYWLMRPGSHQLFFNLVGQLLATPLRLFRYVFSGGN
jgi:glycosyltransferase involved in cell wall biosynthesis